MKEHDTLVTRLSQILIKLNSGEELDMDSLAEEFNVSKRTIQRDLNVRFSYLPLKKENGKYSLESYYLGRLTTADIKNFAILSGVKGLFPSLENGFLKGLLDDATKGIISVRGHHYENIEGMDDVFKELQRAIKAKLLVKLTYSNKNRIIEPYKLINNKGVWYIAAVDEGKLKSFAITKISNLHVTQDIFTPKNEILSTVEGDDGIWFGEVKEIIIHVANPVAHYFRRRQLVPNQNILKELDDGCLLLSTRTAMPEHIMAVVRYWIPHLKIIAPLDIQKNLAEEMKAYIENI